MDKLSKTLRDADSGINKLDDSLGKLDNHQIKSMQSTLNLGKQLRDMVQQTEAYKNKINELAAARKKEESEAAIASKNAFERIKTQAKAIDDYYKQVTSAYAEDKKRSQDLAESKTKDLENYTKKVVQASQEDIKRTKDAADAKDKILNQAHIEDLARTKASADADAKSFRSKIDSARKLDQALKASTAKDALKDTDRAASDLTKRLAQAGKESDNLGRKAENLGKNFKRLADENDNNTNKISAFSRALSGLSRQLDDNSNKSNTFYLRVLGLRLSMFELAAALPAVIGALTDLAGLLVAVADAAGLAAAAIGGALIAGIAEAAPVVGLLVVAFKQLFDIVKLTSDQSKLEQQNKANSDKLSLQHAQHLNQEAQAQLQVANAQRELIKARKDAVRQIQDLNQAEQEAILNSQRATLGLIGSKDALAGLVAGGGSALDIASAQLDVTGAQQAVPAARLAQNRASADAALARKQGVNNNPGVVAARQNLIQQQKDLALSNKEYAQSMKDASQAANELTQKLKDLDPAQRALFDSIVALKKEYKDDWKGITDPIINAFTGVVKGITSALKDPEIQAAFKSLSGATGSAVSRTVSFFGTPEAHQEFLTLIQAAKQNLPLIANILRDITVIFGRIAVAAAPFLHIILKGISDFFDDVTKKTSNKEQLADFFNEAFKAANAFWQVFTGILDIFIALGQGGAAKTGIDLVGQLGQYLHNIAQEINGNKTGTKDFFGNLKITVGDLGTLLDHVLRALVEISETGAFDTIIKVLDQLVLPALESVLISAGKIIVALGNFALAHPNLVKTSLVIAAIGASAIKLFGIISAGIKLMGAYAKASALAAGESEAAAAAAEAGWIAMLGPIALFIAAIAAVGIAIYLLDKKFHFLEPTFKWLKKAFFDVVNYISENWKGLGRILLLLTGPLGVLILLIIENFNKIVKVATWLKNTLSTIFHAIGGNAIVGFLLTALKHVLDALDDIVKFFDTHSLTDIIGGAFKSVISVVNDFIGKLRTAFNILQDIATLGGILGGSGAPAKGFVGNRATAGIVPQGTATSNPGSSTGGGGGAFSSVSSGGSSAGRAILQTASKSIGVPYVWGGTNLSKGVDCSGLVYSAAKAHGINLPRTSQEQSQVGQQIALSDIQPGDLIFYNIPGEGPNSHESIYAGNGQMVVAPHTGTDVQVQPFTTRNLSVIRRINSELDASKQSGGQGPTKGAAATTTISSSGSKSTTPSISTPSGITTIPNFSPTFGSSKKTNTTPPARGGEAINPAIQGLIDFVPNYLTLTIQKVLDQAKIAFTDKSKTGGTALIKVLNEFGGVFDQMARNLTNLLASQKHKLIVGRYRVSGASGNTSVVDTGSDLGDAQNNLSDLGFVRDQLLAQVNDTNQAIGQVTRELSQTKNKNRRNVLQGVLNDLKTRVQDFQASLDQNTVDIAQAQATALQDFVDSVTKQGDRVVNYSQARIAIAKLTGIGKGSIPGLIQQQIDALLGEEGPLQAALAQASAEGNQDLVDSITDQIYSLDEAINQAIEDKFQAAQDAVDEQFTRLLAYNDIAGRLANLGGNSTTSLGRQTGVLQQRGNILRQQLSAEQGLLSQTSNPDDINKIQDAIAELTTQIAENTDALRDNGEQLQQAHEDAINNLASFKGGINSGVGGLIQSLANQNGTFDTQSNLTQLGNQQNNLKTQGTGLRAQLLSQFGINLSNDPSQLIQQLNNTDFGALEFGMDDNTKSLFESLINNIIDNATALVDNTTAIQEANDQQQIQDWSSSLWSTFRDALFTGNGGILGNIPQAASGAQIMAGGLLRVHSGETVVPASISKYENNNNGSPIEININGSQEPVDPIAISKRIAFEMKTR